MRVKIFGNTENKTFGEYSQYVMSKADMSTLLCSRGVITSSADMMESSFMFRCITCPDVKRSQVHMVIQFREFEDMNTTRKEKAKIIQSFLSQMKWSECQYIAVMHNDVPCNAHCHLVVNLIQDCGKRANDSYSILKSRRIVKSMTYAKFGKEMIADPEKEERIMGMVMKAVSESTSLKSLRYNLSMEMIEMEIDGEGKIRFNESGNPVSFSFPGITVLEVVKKMHRIKEDDTQKGKTKKESVKLKQHM